MADRHLPSLATAAACIVIGGCGGGASASAPRPPSGASSAPASQKAPEACSVLTAHMARGFIGRDARRTRKARLNPHGTQCVYSDTTDAHGGSIALIVGDWSFIETSLAGATKHVSGVGDEALESANALLVRKGALGVQVSAFVHAGSSSGAAAAAQQARDLRFDRRVAKAVLSRLP